MSISHAGVVRAVGLAGLAALSVGSWVAARDARGSQPGATMAAASPWGFVRLERGKHPLARPEFDVGPLDPGKRIANLSLVFKPSPAQLQERDALLAAQVDPRSPSYRGWLTTAEYAARFGARPADIARASAWLAVQGLDVKAISPLGARVTFSGTVAQLQSAFRTPMRQYRVGGEMHYAMATAPAIPADLADVVLAVHNTHDFYPHPMLSRTKLPLYDDPMAGEGIGPPDWATIYDVTPLYTTGVSGTPIDGTGVTVAVVGVAQIAQSDVDAFRTLFGLPASTVTMTLVPNTGASAAGQGGAGAEAILDVEWSGAIAKAATVDYVYVGEDDGNVDDATYYAIEQNLASVISESWGGCEEGLTASDADVVGAYGSAANLLGITYMVAAGDTGAGGCLDQNVAGLYADIPASFPGATAVGGTGFPKGAVTFGSNGYATGYGSSETVWNDVPNGGVGGGGISIVFPRPAYQSALTECMPVGTLPLPVTDMRQLPDVALSAGGGALPYFVECTGDSTTMDCAGTGGSPQVFPISGTSASSPSFASVVVLMNQAAGGRLGNINPQLYSLETAMPAPFHDITIGTNEVPCQSGTDLGCPAGNSYGFPATDGYDCASGLGSIDGVNLVKAFSSSSLVKTSTTVMASPTTTTEGADVSLSAAVDVTGTSASTLGGSVAFVFQSYDTSGGFDLSWTLGTSAIMSPTAAGGSASIAPMPIPVGLIDPAAQYVDVYAVYGGDAAHQGSVSPKVRITFGPVSFCVSPALSNIAVGGKLTFTGMGGVPPVKWYVDYDSTCDENGNNCSTLDETTGAFTAGVATGYVTVTGLDTYGAEAFADVVAGDAADTGAPPWSTPATCGAVADAGTDGAVQDSGAATDSGAAPDAAVSHDDGGPGSTVKAGCGCETAGRGGSPAGLLAGAALGLGIALARRRRNASEALTTRAARAAGRGCRRASSAAPR